MGVERSQSNKKQIRTQILLEFKKKRIKEKKFTNIKKRIIQ